MRQRKCLRAAAKTPAKKGTGRTRRGAARPRIDWVDWCEIRRGRDFFAWREKVDWAVTNPPWSRFGAILRHAMEVADEVVFLVTVDHLWTPARLREITAAGFGVKEIVLVDTPPTFPRHAFQLGVVHLSRGWTGVVTLGDWRGKWLEPWVPSPGPTTLVPQRHVPRILRAA